MARSVEFESAREDLRALLESVGSGGEVVVVEVGGRALAVVVSPEQYERLEPEIERQRVRAASDALYDRYVQPLEATHWGQFVAVMQDGRMVVGPDDREVLLRAVEELGRGSHMFKIGPRVVGRILRATDTVSRVPTGRRGAHRPCHTVHAGVS